MKVLIAGASGFIGKNLILSCPSDWEVWAIFHTASGFPAFVQEHGLHHVKPVQVDLSASESINNALTANAHFEICIFLAANGDPALSVKRPAFDLQSNTVSLVNLMERITCGTMIFFSSGAVYDRIQGAVSPQISVNPKLPYAISKLSAEHYVRYFHHQERIQSRYMNVRFFGAYGPYEAPRKIYNRLIRQFAIAKNPSFAIRGNGKNLIDAMFIDDTICAIHRLIQSNQPSATVDLYSGNPYTLTELVTTIATVFGIEPLIKYEGIVPEYIEFYSVDKQMQDRFEFQPKISLEEGLIQFHDFLLHHE